jgi:hypothetical protein
MSDFLSGPASVPGYSPEPHSLMAPIQIGVSTQEEVIGALGNPTDRQQSLDETSIESWAYVSHGETVPICTPSWRVRIFPLSRE